MRTVPLRYSPVDRNYFGRSGWGWHCTLIALCIVAFTDMADFAGAGSVGDVKRTCNPTNSHGSSNDIEGQICVAIGSDGFSVKGDLDVFVINRDNRKKYVNISCETTFTLSSEFTPRKYKSGSVQLRLDQMNDSDHYIIVPQLDRASVNNWQVFSTNDCTWTTEAVMPSTETPTGLEFSYSRTQKKLSKPSTYGNSTTTQPLPKRSKKIPDISGTTN